MQALRRTLLDKVAVAYAEAQRQPSSIFPEVKKIDASPVP
jgi:hypothetical protein